MTEQTERSMNTAQAYNHQSRERTRRFLRFLLKHIGFNFLAKIDRVEGVENIPSSGPAILMINHIAFVDPIVVLHLTPRNVVPMAKIEVYDLPVIGIVPKLWGVIPVRREEFDRKAIRQALDVLAAGEIILLAPEGTRSPALQRGREGVAYLASRSGAPVVPVAVEGTIGFPTFIFSKRWRKPGAVVRFGKPCRFRPEYSKARGEELRLMTDEALYVLAKMLPKERRGVYSDLSQATERTLML